MISFHFLFKSFTNILHLLFFVLHPPHFSLFNLLTADFNPKASKKSLIETLLYALREAIDNQVDEGEDSEQDQNEEEEVEQDESEDEAYQPRDDPSYRSELDGDLAEEQDQIEDDEEEEGDDEDEDTFVARMRKKLGLTDSKSNYFISGWTDPTFLFCIGTLMSVIFVRGNSEAQVLEIVPLNEIPSLLKEHFLDPVWIAGALFLYAAYSQTKEYVQHRFSNSQRIEAGWYLWNGAVIHVMMDGCAGGGWFNATEGGGWGLSLMVRNLLFSVLFVCQKIKFHFSVLNYRTKHCFFFFFFFLSFL